MILFAPFSYVRVLTAPVHASVARGAAGAAGRPLAQAKDLLKRSGPLP